MKPDINCLSRDTIVEFIGSIFDRRGDEEYLGEPVNMGQHMLQGATIAEQNDQPEEIIVGALLHAPPHSASGSASKGAAFTATTNSTHEKPKPLL